MSDNFIREKVLELFPNPLVIIVYGSYVYNPKNYRDIDILVIGNKKLHVELGKLEIYVLNLSYLLKNPIEGARYFIFPYKILYGNKIDKIIRDLLLSYGRYVFKDLDTKSGVKTINRKAFLKTLQIVEAMISGYLNNKLNKMWLPERSLHVLPKILYFKDYNSVYILKLFLRNYFCIMPKKPFLIKNVNINIQNFTYYLIKLINGLYSIGNMMIKRNRNLLLNLLYFSKRQIHL